MRAACAVLAAGLLLAACGGGGGGGAGEEETLWVSVTYAGSTIQLFSDVPVRPQLSGFEGRPARCELTGGSMPPGLSLESGCDITGRALKPGTYPIRFNVSASGASGTVSSATTLQVLAPRAEYVARFRPNAMVPVGSAVEEAPTIQTWTPPPGVPLTWTYTLASGSLAPGLSLNPATGVVSGTATTAGSYSAVFAVLLATPFGSYQLPDAAFPMDVGTPSFSYQNESGTGTSATGVMSVFIGQPFRASPLLAPEVGVTRGNFALGAGQALPAGLVLDPATGRITGTPTGTPAGVQRVDPITATQTYGTKTLLIVGRAAFDVQYPMYVTYPPLTTALGASLTIFPHVVSLSRLTTPTYAYTPRAGQCALPPGVTINLVTGVVSGTPTARGSFACTLDMTLGDMGVQWPGSAEISIVVQ